MLYLQIDITYSCHGLNIFKQFLTFAVVHIIKIIVHI